MKQVEHLANFVHRASYEEMSEQARRQLKIRVLDALGCAIGALEGEPVRLIRKNVFTFGGASLCSLIAGGRTAPDRAAFYNSALVRYLDFNDGYLAKGETCHPSDNLGAVLAACEYANRSGRDFLCALAVAYQVQCRLSDVAPVRSKGFDHTVQGAYAVAAGVSKALGLDAAKTAQAVAIAGTAFNALRVTRTGALSNWKGLAYPDLAFSVTHTTFLAGLGITGPLEVFEGNKGLMNAITGPFEIDWQAENLEKVRDTVVKKFNAELHSQSALEGVLELKQEHPFQAEQVRKIEVDIFDVAFKIIGGGEEGDKIEVHTKEEADHSLPYMLSAAILDGQVLPEQYDLERINRPDIQVLLRQIEIRPSESYSRRFPAEFPCRIAVTLHDGQVLVKEKADYEGFHTRPVSWDMAVRKFSVLSSPYVPGSLRDEIVAAVDKIDSLPVTKLTGLLNGIQVPGLPGEESNL
ncbi:MAG TPA: MmgE/PrpD family protein [Anaerolineales bacterium]